MLKLIWLYFYCIKMNEENKFTVSHEQEFKGKCVNIIKGVSILSVLAYM